MLRRYVRDWKSIEAHIGTKTAIQVCSLLAGQRLQVLGSSVLLTLPGILQVYLVEPAPSTPWRLQRPHLTNVVLLLVADTQPRAEVLPEAGQERQRRRCAAAPPQAPGAWPRVCAVRLDSLSFRSSLQNPNM